MSDEALNRRLAIRRTLLVALLLLLVAAGLFYFRFSTAKQVQLYKSQKAQEVSAQNQVDQLTAGNAQLIATIEENGKELVSFSDDKIKYINLASELSKSHSVRINKLTVSDIWQEGEMSGMTTAIEIEGDLSSVRGFVEEYCGVNYTNRINIVSCRPSGRYVWLDRGIDAEKVLGWFDLSKDEALYEEMEADKDAEERRQNAEFGLAVASSSQTQDTPPYRYDPNTASFVDIVTGEPVDYTVLDETPITLEKMFANTPYKVYLVIDFLGRA